MAADKSYSSLKNNLFSRRFGGTTKGTADPHITGYFYIQLENLPPKLADGTGGLSTNDISLLIQSNTNSITLPGATLSKTTFDGLGGLKWHVPTMIEIGDTLTLKHVEFSGLPMFRIYHAWFNLIRDYRSGISQLKGSDYTKSSYACNLIYAAVKPDGLTVDFAVYATGMFPTKDPYDIYGSDITAVDKLEYEQEFSVDYIFVNDSWVMKKAKALAESAHKGAALVEKGEIGV
jgi:hypothetical protein